MKVQLKNGLINVASAGTAVPLSATTKWVFGLQLVASAANAGVMYLGDENVDATNGREIAAGALVDFKDLLDSETKVNLADIYVDAANADEDITFNYFQEKR